MEWLIGVLWGLQVTKVILNWTVHNLLNPKQKVKFGINHPGMLFEKGGINKAFERDLMFVYCCFVFFWIKIPKQGYGKFLAWSVLGISIIQAMGALILVKVN